jgi:hypothetical protein
VAFRVRVSRTELRAAVMASRAKLPNESGGILVGWYSGRTIHVCSMLVVPDTGADSHNYQRDAAAASLLLSEEVTRHDGHGYVGEWHSHTRMIGPSGLDRRSISVLASGSRLPLALIVLGLGQTRFRRYIVTSDEGRSLWGRLRGN